MSSTYTLLSRLDTLRLRRHPMYYRNRFVKVLMYFLVIYYAALLLFLGVVLPGALRDEATCTAAFHSLDAWAFVLLIIDFYCRFMLQDTPAHQAKPFALLPVKRRTLMHIYLVHALKSWGNLFWLFFLVPFALISVRPTLGWSGFALWLLAYQCMFWANALAYLLARAALMRHFAYLLVPLVLHAAFLFAATTSSVIPHAFTLYIYGMAEGHVWGFALLAAVLAALYYLNVRVQGSIVYDDVAHKEETAVKIRHASRMKFLESFGTLGEYLKLEVRLRLRNKQVRMQMLVLFSMTLLLAALMYFTPVYDGTFMTSFICLYNYVDLPLASLLTVMCYEGNYIDALMSRRESILDLLRAKFYFNALLLLLPLLITTPLMCIGKIGVWMNFAYLSFTLGLVFPLCFQMAVYNKETLPLTGRLTRKQGTAAQNIMSGILLFAPIGIVQLATLLLGDPTGYIILTALGLIGFALHPLWLRNVYHRMVQRRYINMEGFRTSRQ